MGINRVNAGKGPPHQPPPIKHTICVDASILGIPDPIIRASTAPCIHLFSKHASIYLYDTINACTM